MEEWKEYRLGDIIEIKSGFAYKGDMIGYGENILLGMGCVSYKERFLMSGARTYAGNCADRYCANSGDIVLATRQQSDNLPILGMPAIIPNELSKKRIIIGANLYRVDNESDFSNEYIYWLLKTPLYVNHIRSCQSGTTVRMITKANIEDFRFKAPGRKERDRISTFLKTLDNKIEVNRRIHDNLEQQAQALFKSWFVDFEPFRDGEFEESELGRIPKGWRVYSMDELVEVIGGYSYKGSELQDSNIAMATIKNFNRNGGFKIDGFKEIIPSPKAKPDQYLAKYDILIAHTDLTQNADIIGNPALLLNFGDYERIIMSMDLVKVNSKVESITYGLLYSFFADSRFKSHALGYVNGTTVLHLSKKSIPEYKIALPCDLTIVNQYGLILNSLFEKESFIIDESRRLAELRDTLLPRLMSGELKVNDVDA